METFVNVGSNIPGGYEGFAADNANDMELPIMFSQGLNMSPDEFMSS